MATACLLLLLCPPPGWCSRSPPSLQGGRDYRLAREGLPRPGHTPRQPRLEAGQLTAVIDVAEDVDQSPDSAGDYTHASLTKPGMPADFTLCGAFRTEAWTQGLTSALLFSINGEDGRLWGYVWMGASSSYTTYFVAPANDVRLLVKKDRAWFPLTWTLVCMSLDTVSGRVILVVDGQVIEVSSHQEAMEADENRPTDLHMALGYSLDPWGFVEEFSGQYSNINIFSSPLSKERMVAMTQAGGKDCGAPGDFLSWEEAQWQLHSKARLQMVGELEGPCRRESQVFVYTADFEYHSQCMQHCQKMGKGRSPALSTLQELETLQTELHAITPNLKDLPWLWLSATDGQKEGVWRDYYTGKQLQDYAKPWHPGHDARNGDTYNCLSMYTDTPDDEAWGESTCQNTESSRMGCPCHYNLQPILLLRGLCGGKDSKLDKQFTPKQPAGTPNDMILMGDVSTRIQYNENSSQWVMTDSRSKLTAVSRASKVSYVLGKHKWTVTGDVYDCHEGQPYTTFLKLSGCSKGEFTCNDGQCVTMEQRCDQLPDCRDKSDERGCQLLVIEEGYNKNVPPITSVSETDRTVLAVSVDISISLLKIVSMEEVQHKIDFQFGIILEWKDNRVTFNNLKDATSLNALTEEDIGRLWLPYVIYANTDMKEAVQLEEGLDTTIVVTREGNFTRSGIEVTDETEVFEGKENKLSMYQTYTKSFQCLYNLQKYPFDTQVRY